MSDVAIRCEGLGKQYRLGERERYKALRDTLTDVMYAPARRLRSIFKDGADRPLSEVRDNTFWALKDVSFEVKHGDVVGIIGRNGAGKSTLLKILSRITKPTEGHVKINGRVGSLLEVGTGFHPELTGRENIYLNGAILGMKRAEIDRKFDEIVAFAEIEKFIDTPVKRYSSGMYVRLAFAVAAHLEPEILIIDEVLAVGDAAFQRKCLGKMDRVAQEGRTVLFVSHNFEAIKSLCKRAVLLECGEIIEDNEPAVCIEKALAQVKMHTAASNFEVHTIRSRTGLPQPIAVSVRASKKSPGDIITFDDDIVATLQLDSAVGEGHTFAFQVLTNTGIHIFNSFYRDDKNNPPLRPGKTLCVSVTIPRNLLPAGVYEASFAYMLPNAELFWVTRNTWFDVAEIDSYRNRAMVVKRTGVVALILPWSTS